MRHLETSKEIRTMTTFDDFFGEWDEDDGQAAKDEATNKLEQAIQHLEIALDDNHEKNTEYWTAWKNLVKLGYATRVVDEGYATYILDDFSIDSDERTAEMTASEIAKKMNIAIQR